MRESNLHRPYVTELEMQKVDQVLDKILRFAAGAPLKNVPSSEEKMKLLALSVPAYELLTLHTQVAFKVSTNIGLLVLAQLLNKIL